ncbi:hypothetical protein [Dysgonomonas massiliensis]|uniref:hypothetical protein n=1 Tax=Dysgonomonas massiliensis TaxID=2040292 RepID=UPI000C78A834|nr:hypothetical protein [Dysgonomonas massiliensis]
MKNWKIAFWICLTISITITALLVFIILFQVKRNIEASYTNDQIVFLKKELNIVTDIFKGTDLSKHRIDSLTKEYDEYKFFKYYPDSISLYSISIKFENDTLKHIRKRH